jgi:hypothetical protein
MNLPTPILDRCSAIHVVIATWSSAGALRLLYLFAVGKLTP